MKQTLLALAGLALVGATGCVSNRGLHTGETYERPITRLATPNNEKRVDIGVVESKDNRYNIRSIVLHGTEYHVEPIKYPREGELAIGLTPFEDIRLRVNDDTTKEAVVDSDHLYIPTLQFLPDGRLVDAAEFKQTGPKAVRANVTHYDTRNVMSGIINRSQKDFETNIGTARIGIGRELVELYTPEAEHSPNMLNFYAVEKKGSTQIIHPSGKVGLEQLRGFYRPQKVSRKELEARAPSTTDKPLEGDNPGLIAVPLSTKKEFIAVPLLEPLDE